MSNYGTTAVHQMNKWLWSELRTLTFKDGLAFGKYRDAGGPIGIVPLLPSQQLTQLTELADKSEGAPFIVYNYADMEAASWWLEEQQATYIIYDDDEYRLRTIHTFMKDLLKRQDWTAADINDWLRAESEPGTPATNFDFKWVRLSTSVGPEPFGTLGGRQAAMVAVRIGFTHDMDNRGMRI